MDDYTTNAAYWPLPASPYYPHALQQHQQQQDSSVLDRQLHLHFQEPLDSSQLLPHPSFHHSAALARTPSVGRDTPKHRRSRHGCYTCRKRRVKVRPSPPFLPTPPR